MLLNLIKITEERAKEWGGKKASRHIRIEQLNPDTQNTEVLADSKDDLGNFLTRIKEFDKFKSLKAALIGNPSLIIARARENKNPGSEKPIKNNCLFSDNLGHFLKRSLAPFLERLGIFSTSTKLALIIPEDEKIVEAKKPTQEDRLPDIIDVNLLADFKEDREKIREIFFDCSKLKGKGTCETLSFMQDPVADSDILKAYLESCLSSPNMQ